MVLIWSRDVSWAILLLVLGDWANGKCGDCWQSESIERDLDVRPWIVKVHFMLQR